jgi:hypothetical protein
MLLSVIRVVCAAIASVRSRRPHRILDPSRIDLPGPSAKLSGATSYLISLRFFYGSRVVSASPPIPPLAVDIGRSLRSHFGTVVLS